MERSGTFKVGSWLYSQYSVLLESSGRTDGWDPLWDIIVMLNGKVGVAIVSDVIILFYFATCNILLHKPGLWYTSLQI